MSYLIPGTWARFARCIVIYELLNKVGALWTDTKLFWCQTNSATKRRWTETLFPKHFNLWQLNVGDCGPPGISNNAPLFYLHFFPAGVFFPSPPSLPPSILCPSNMSAEGEAERLSCSQHGASLLIMHRWHHYKSNHGAVINSRLIKKTGWRTNKCVEPTSAHAQRDAWSYQFIQNGSELPNQRCLSNFEKAASW